jgi:hypothetical protein
MMNKVKQKISQSWNWIKEKWQKFCGWVKAKWKPIAAIIAIGTVLAAGEILTPPKLDCSKADILYSQEFIEIKYQTDAEGKYILDENKNPLIESQEQIVSYACKSGEIAPPLENEIIGQRTPHIVYRNLGGNERSAQSGYNFYKEGNDWKQVKFATTTKEVFDKATLSFIERVFAADTGATSPDTMATSSAVGTVTWNNINNAKVKDNTYTDATSKTFISYYLKASNFGFSIPSGATINGIIAEIKKCEDRTYGTAQDEYIYIIKSDATLGTENKADTTNYWINTGCTIDNPYTSYGANNDLWSESWSDTDINDSDFGIAISADVKFSGEIGSAEGKIDHIRITVYYTEGGGGAAEEILPRGQLVE